MGTIAGSSLEVWRLPPPPAHPSAASGELISETTLGPCGSAQPLYTSSLLKFAHPVLYMVVTSESKVTGDFFLSFRLNPSLKKKKKKKL